MSNASARKIIVGLDIGTSKVVAIVGEQNDQDEIEVIGLGSSPSLGLKKGVVVDIESTEQAIKNAIQDAELMSGCKIYSCLLYTSPSPRD